MLTKLKPYLAPIIIVVLLLYILMTPKGDSSTLRRSQETGVVTQETSLSVVPKVSQSDPDLIVDQHYVAIVNKEKLEVPIKTTKGSNGTIGTTANVKQEIDVTSIVDQMTPDWEIGIGLGYHKELYVPVSIQRNYERNKAIEVELHVDLKNLKPNGYEIQHKWTF